MLAFPVHQGQTSLSQAELLSQFSKICFSIHLLPHLWSFLLCLLHLLCRFRPSTFELISTRYDKFSASFMLCSPMFSHNLSWPLLKFPTQELYHFLQHFRLVKWPYPMEINLWRTIFTLNLPNLKPPISLNLPSIFHSPLHVPKLRQDQQTANFHYLSNLSDPKKRQLHLFLPLLWAISYPTN